MSFIPEDAIKQWADLTANNQAYKDAPPEKRAAVQKAYFTDNILPKVSPADSEKSLLEWAYTVSNDPSAVYQNSTFLAMPETERKRILRGRLVAEGQQVTNQENKGGFVDDYLRGNPNAGPIGAAYTALRPEQPTEFDPKVEAEYSKFENDPAVSQLRNEARIAEVAKPGDYVKRNVSAMIPGETASGWAKDANDKLLRTKSLEQAFPGVKPIGTATTIAATLPAAVAIEGALPITSFGSWLGNSAAQAAVATPMIGEPVNPNSNSRDSDINTQTLANGLTNLGVGAAVTGALSPVVRNAAAETVGQRISGAIPNRLKTRLGIDTAPLPERVAGTQLARDTRKLAPVGQDDTQIMQQLQSEQQALHQGGGPVIFTGAESGSKALKDMQVNVPGQNPLEVKATQFNTPVQSASEAVDAAKPTNSNLLSIANEYIKTKLRPQVAADFATGKDQAIAALKQQTKDSANALYENARKAGVLGESVGVTRGELATQIDEILTSPEIQPHVKSIEGLKAVRDIRNVSNEAGEEVTSSIMGADGKPMVTKLPEKLDDAPLTVDNIVKYAQSVAEDMDNYNGEGAKAIMDVLDSALSGAQSQKAQAVRASYAQGQKDLATKVALTKATFNAEAGLEASLAKQPLTRALTSGKAENVANTLVDAKNPLPSGELQSVINDPIKHKATKAALSADIADSLMASPDGKSKVYNPQSFYEKYGSDEAFGKLKQVFHDNPKYIKKLEEVRAAGKAGKQFDTARDTANTPKGSKGKLASAVAGESLGVRSQLTNESASRLSNFFNESARKLINDSVGDKSKAMKIFDRAIKVQKGRASYKDIYNEVVSPLAQGIAPKAAMNKDSDVPPAPLKLTIGQKKPK